MYWQVQLVEEAQPAALGHLARTQLFEMVAPGPRRAVQRLPELWVCRHLDHCPFLEMRDRVERVDSAASAQVFREDPVSRVIQATP